MEQTRAQVKEDGTKLPIINCHTHIFTGDNVPPFLAKTYLPWPFYYLMHLSLFVSFFRWWYKGPAAIPQKPWYKKMMIVRNNIHRLLKKAGIIIPLISLWLLLQVIFILLGWLSVLFPAEGSVINLLTKAQKWLTDNNLLIHFSGNFLKVLLVLFVLLFIPWGRRLIFLLFKKIYSILGKLPGKQTKEMIKRYLNIGRYSFNGKQGYVLGKLENQYPEGSGFVILPMDMEYMGAGKVKAGYSSQMEDLVRLKERKNNPYKIYPFVFADPRRMAADKNYFKYTTDKGKITLEDCFIKEYIETHSFSGFKIYPALGYYVFDEELLALWKYAADNRLPVLTHCIRGTIFYRGRKKSEWSYHPIFKQAMGGYYEKLLLPQMKNVDFSVNFTHPLNYLCLLDETMLRKIVHTAIVKNPESKLREVFGYTGEETPLLYNLRHLKLCFGHFGGDDEWARYFEQDRYGHSNQFTESPYTGIDFFHTKNGEPSPGKEEQLWKYTDWYSIICSIMLQYENVYADISYILHSDREILPLLKQTLDNDELRKKVLYGTDFYVVRNHKSDKNILADMMGGLSVDDFDQIARVNPGNFLKL